MPFARALVAWLALLVVMFANGALRVAVLQPRLGEDAARQLATLLGVLIVFAAAGVFVRTLPSPRPGELLAVGLLWLLLTVAFETLMGRYVSRLSWEQVFADYDVSRGRLWPLVLVAVSISPWLWGVIRKGG